MVVVLVHASDSTGLRRENRFEHRIVLYATHEHQLVAKYASLIQHTKVGFAATNSPKCF